jgi:benzoate-CoA ligase
MPERSQPSIELPVAATQLNFAEHLIRVNAARPHKTAYIDDACALSYQQLSEQIRSVAAALQASGLKREERVLLLMHDCTDWVASFLGCIYAGIVPVAVNTLLTADDYAYMLQHSRAQAALVSGALLPVLQSGMDIAAKGEGHEVGAIYVSRSTETLPTGCAAWSALLETSPANQHCLTQADEAAFWLYSSGSTGRPKGTVHTHANAFYTAELYGKGVLGMKESDVCFSAAKLFFAYGLGNALSFPLSVGATTVLMAERPTPDAVFKRWKGESGSAGGIKPSIFFGAPTGFAGMLAAPNLPAKEDVALRMCSSAGEALPAELGERFSAHFDVPIVDGIGSTEMLHIFLSNTPEKLRYGTTGWPVPGYEIELRGEHGGSVPDGEPGDLYIKGPSSALMYWNNREKSRNTFQGVWTKSGDKYVKNADGSYTYSGRSDDMLKVSGIYVSPFEVEATLVQHSAVLEAAVIGKEEQGLTKTKAFVVLKSGHSVTDEELKAFVKDRLAPFKYPRYIEFVSELPKTATGKIQRFKLRELEKSRG